MEGKRKESIRIRLSAEELKQVRDSAKRAGCSMSEYAREKMGLSQAPSQDEGREGAPSGGGFRSDRLCIRFTPGERAWLEERAAWLDCTVSSLVCRVLFSEKVFQPVVIDAGALRKAWLELHYQGVNLNELMAHLNTCKGEADARDVEGVLAKVDRQMDRLDGIMDDLERQKKVAFGKARGGGRR